MFNPPIILTQKYVSCLVVPSYDDHVLFSYETGRILALRYHLGCRLLGGFLGRFIIVEPTRGNKTKLKVFFITIGEFGRLAFPIIMSPARVEISFGPNSIMTQRTDKTINEKM